MQMRRAREMIINLIDEPQHYHAHFATFSSSVCDPSARDDPLIRRAILLKTFPFSSTNIMAEMTDVPFSIMRSQHMVGYSRCIVLAIGIDSLLTKGENFLGQLSMVAEHLQRMEKQDHASKPMFEECLKESSYFCYCSYETVGGCSNHMSAA
ncbi:hypothetical protein DFH29DRAFT_968888 [Suillus ampliporus]|nr:hypothetical protein DFH29DRAFT_968888 [Suillus ampliporus]